MRNTTSRGLQSKRMKSVQRCAWVNLSVPLYVTYHDVEWGVPVHTDRKMFEFLVLESAQAGLSWLTVLRKRAAYKKAFAHFDYTKVAKFTNRDIERLMNNAGIIRNRQKITAAVKNAKAFLQIRTEFGTFCNYLWQFVDGESLQPKPATIKHLPAMTDLSVQIAKDMKRRGFSFLGPTVMYAHLQATGLVNDHTRDCFRYKLLRR